MRCSRASRAPNRRSELRIHAKWRSDHPTRPHRSTAGALPRVLLRVGRPEALNPGHRVPAHTTVHRHESGEAEPQQRRPLRLELRARRRHVQCCCRRGDGIGVEGARARRIQTLGCFFLPQSGQSGEAWCESLVQWAAKWAQHMSFA